MRAYWRQPPRQLFSVAFLAASAVGGLLMSAMLGCSLPAPAPPHAELLIATADSTFWVSTTRDGVHVRGVPMTLAQYGGRFHEVYVADLDRSYTDAIFTGERVYVRDIMTDDSTLVYEDSAVMKLANAHAKRHPRAEPLGPDDETPEEPDVSVRGETDILSVGGPYVLVEHRSSVEQAGGEQYDTVRAAIDLRTGRHLSFQELLQTPDAHDSASVAPLPHRWQRKGYALLARSDSASGSVSFVLRDALQRTWPVVTVGRDARVYWLDVPPVDARTRQALSRAFNAAASYDEETKYVRDDVARDGPGLSQPQARSEGSVARFASVLP